MVLMSVRRLKGGASVKIHRLFLALVVVAGLAGVAYVSQLAESAGSKMADAAEQFLGALTAEQKGKATFAFDDRERFNWHFVPLQDNKTKKATRNGLPLEEMNAAQRAAALALVKAGTSADGYTQATAVMSLEAILHELEKNGAMVRNPEWYFFAVFGKPSKTGKWGWRVEGHHLSLNFTLDNGKVVSATPCFYGANPATVKAGPRKGLRTLAPAEDLARDLFKGLDDEQKKTAYRDKQFPEIAGKTKDPSVGEPVGLTYAKMTPKQRETLATLIQSYADRLPPDVAEAEMKQIKQTGLDPVHFAWAGDTEPGKPHSYRVQGPTFVIEFLNTQADAAGNPANHIHSAWRRLPADFAISE
jgi:hypothetical protein